MALVFEDPDVLRFSAVNEADPWRGGTYIVKLTPEPRQLSFHWEARSRAAHDHQIAVHLPAPLTIERRTSRSAARPQAPQVINPTPELGSLVLPSMSSPGFDRIVVGAGTQREEYELWYVTGSFTIRTHGTHSADNTKFRQVSRLIHDSPAPLPLGLGAVETTHWIRDEQTAQVLDELDAWRYYGLVEFVGQIEPHDAPGGYRFLRTKTHRITSFVDTTSHMPSWLRAAPRRTAPTLKESSRDAPDTNNESVSDWIPNQAGRVFDNDGPGNLLTSSDESGYTEEFSADFAQSLVIGDRIRAPNVASESRLLERKHWRFRASYRIVEVYSQHHNRPRIERYDGAPWVLEEYTP